MADFTEILTPSGRLVSGSVWDARTTDADGNPLLIKHGVNKGQPRTECYFAIAIPKTDPEWPELYGVIAGEAKKCFPQFFDAVGNCALPTFSFKLTDGDSQVPNKKGNKPCDREGYPGCWVVHFSSSSTPKCYSTHAVSILTDPNSIKRGSYIRVSGSVKGNGSSQMPGVYLNHSMVEITGYGEEIRSGPDGVAVFGAKPAALPAGASATPLAPTTPIAAAAPPPPATPGMLPPGLPTFNAAGAAAVTPVPGFLNPTAVLTGAVPAPVTAPPPPPVTTVPPPPPAATVPPPVGLPLTTRRFVVNGSTFTGQQLLDAGYLPDQIEAFSDYPPF